MPWPVKCRIICLRANRGSLYVHANGSCILFLLLAAQEKCAKKSSVRQVILQRKTLLSAVVLTTVAKTAFVTNSGTHCLIQVICSVYNTRFCFTEENCVALLLPVTWEVSLDRLIVENFGTALKSSSKNVV